MRSAIVFFHVSTSSATRVAPLLLLFSLCLARIPTPAREMSSVSDGPKTSILKKAQDAPPAKIGPLGPGQAGVAAAYARLPMSFEANHGQAGPSVDFVARGQGYALALAGHEAVLDLRQTTAASADASQPGEARPSTVSVQLSGAATDRPPDVVGIDPLPGTTNYFIGNDPAQWHTDIPTFSRVEYLQVYPGIDVVYFGNRGQLEYDFVVAPGADPSVIRVGFVGAEEVKLDETGELVLHVGGGQLHEAVPVIYQEGPQGRQPVTGGYGLNDQGEVGFTVGEYDATRPLVIDPVLVYSTYVSGSGLDNATGIAVDRSGSAYVTGFTRSADFRTSSGAFDPTLGGFQNAFVSKLNPEGTALVYSTFLGGNNFDQSDGISVDSLGSAYITGTTKSTDFPTTPGAIQAALVSTQDAFVSKLNPSGTALIYSTFLGGSDAPRPQEPGDWGYAIAVDSFGNAFVTGSTKSPNFPITPGAFQTTYRGGTIGGAGASAFVSKINSTGTALVYSTFLGGSRLDEGRGIAVDLAGNTFITGLAFSSDFPITPGAFQASRRGSQGAFVTKINASGSSLVYSTFLGSSGAGLGIAVNATGEAYVTGVTQAITFFPPSSDFPTTTGAFQQSIRGPENAFIARFNASGSSLIYSTFLGGSSYDSGLGITLDSGGNAYVTGTTASSDFPTTSEAIQQTVNGFAAAFVSKLNPTGTTLVYSTLLGGNGFGVGMSIALDGSGSAYIDGFTSSANFPTTSGAFQTSPHNGNESAFVAKISSGSVVANSSLTLNGTTAYAEALNASDLNITGDWTVEAWFKDEDPMGFNHDWRQILMKGDRNASSEAPYYALVGFNHLLAGVRTGGQDYPINYNLAAAGVSPTEWHHLAVTFRADLNVLNLWIDGRHISYQQVPTHSSIGNALPVEIGRNGPSTGKYWLGKVDDVRIWNIARNGSDITGTYQTPLVVPQPGLVANWNFDQGTGATAFDTSSNHHDAVLNGGAVFSTDVHP